MTADKKTRPTIVGGISLMMTAVVLSLTVFTLLALSSVRADKILSDASVQSITAYYTADLSAETIFAQIRLGQIPAGVQIDGHKYSYQCPVSDTQYLAIEIVEENGIYTVLRWQAVTVNR